MTDILSLTGGSGSDIDLMDHTAYLADDKFGDSFNDEPNYLEQYVTLPAGGRKLQRRILIGDTITFDVLCIGDTFDEAYSNFLAIRDKLDSAGLNQLTGAGTPVMFNEKRQNQSSTVSMKVVGGTIKRKNWTLLAAGYVEAVLRLETSPV